MSRRARFALLIFGFATAFGLLEFAYRYLDVLTRQEHESPLIKLIEEITGAYSAFMWVPAVIWVTRRYPLDARHWLRNLPKHLLLLTVAAFTATSFMWGSRVLLFPLFGLGPYDYGTMPTRYFMEFPVQAIGYIITMFIVRFYDAQVRATQLEKSLAQAQLHNLRLQLQPHFLFNTLNTISSVMYEDVRVADRMIARLSDLLRMSLEQGGSQEVTLEREMEFLRLYVETMKARFEERLNVQVDADADIRNALVPPLLLQPLVENSIRHGADPHRRSWMCVSGRIGPMARWSWKFAIMARGWRAQKMPRCTKAWACRTRPSAWSALYGGSHHIDLQNAADGGLVVTLQVPFHVDQTAAGR